MITLKQARQHPCIGKFYSDLQKLVFELDCKKVLEIGCYEFNSSIILLNALKKTDGILFSCDIRQPLDITHPRFRFYKMKSDQFFQKISNEAPFQLAFIDGDHTYEQVKRDILNAMKIVDGFIAVHDISEHIPNSPSWPSGLNQPSDCQVNKAWNEIIAGREIYYEKLFFPGLGVFRNHLNSNI